MGSEAKGPREAARELNPGGGYREQWVRGARGAGGSSGQLPLWVPVTGGLGETLELHSMESRFPCASPWEVVD